MTVASFRSRTTKNVQQIARFSEQKCGGIFGISREILIAFSREVTFPLKEVWQDSMRDPTRHLMARVFVWLLRQTKIRLRGGCYHKRIAI